MEDKDRLAVVRELRRRVLIRQVGSVKAELSWILDDAELLGVADRGVSYAMLGAECELDRLLKRLKSLENRQLP